MKQRGTIFLFVLSLASLSVKVFAGPILIYFEENGGSSNPWGLYNFDVMTGVSTLRPCVGGSGRFFAMDVRPSDKTVFTVDFSSGGLFTIDVGSGATALIGNTGITGPLWVAFDPETSALLVWTSTSSFLV